MSALKFNLVSGEVGLVAATAKTVLMAVAATNHRTIVEGITISFKGIVPTDTPVRCRLIRPTTAGTSTAVTAVKNNPSLPEVIQTTAGKNFSVEPTAGDVLDDFEIHPQTGQKWFYPMSREIEIPGGGRLSLECTAAQAQTVAATFECEE